jgi:signal transduction histidine kinase
LRVDTRLDPALSIVTWAGEFKQILSNLISNAFDACRHGGVVTIRMRLTQIRPTSSPALRFTVADNGVGIPREHQAAIFEPFFTTKEFVGTGLGLWVTKSLIDKRGGKLQVRSRNTSPSGTVMSFCFPVELPDVEPQRLH